MSAAIRFLYQKGLRIRPAHGGLAVKPKCLITDELMEFIKANKKIILSELAENGGVQSAFQIRAAGKQFAMVIPGGGTRDEALAEARTHWPDAEVI